MKIYLYLDEEIVSFSLPEIIEGSYSFDYKNDESFKLINVEARDGAWYLYSTSDVKVYSNNTILDSIVISSGNYYVLKREDINYIIYVNELTNNKLNVYSYGADLNLLIGSGNEATIKYLCPFLGNATLKVYVQNKQLVLENSSMIKGVYVNQIALLEQSYSIKFGDQINFFGLKIILKIQNHQDIVLYI